MGKLHLPCLRGQVGGWTYFSTVMRIKDIISQNISTVSESEHLYTENINEVLQREIKVNRTDKISKFIRENDEHFVNTLVLAIHQGDPKWSDFGINSDFRIDGELMSTEGINFIENKLGVLTLGGNEEIFALDGQHRLVGMRDAFSKNPEVGEDEISLIFVIHDQSNVEKTRRLFTVLNKYAEKPRGAELIILDEDDAAAINTRRLVTEHQHLKKSKALSNSKNGGMVKSDVDSLTNLVTINNINKILYNKPSSYYTKRPSVEELDQLYSISKKFWDSLFYARSELVGFIDGNITDTNMLRNDASGGSLLLRPVGQLLIANAYCSFSPEELALFKTKLSQIDFNLSSANWKYLYWNDKMIGKEDALKKAVINYILGKSVEMNITTEMTRIYSLYGATYSNQITPV